MVKLKVGELPEQESLPMDVSPEGGHAEIAATCREALTGVHVHGPVPMDRPGGPCEEEPDGHR